MKEREKLLSSILQTAQMGQSGIRSIQEAALRPTLRAQLESQLECYDAIADEAMAIAAQRGYHLRQLSPAVRGMANMTARARLRGRNIDSKIAGMMIQGSTRGMITGLKNLHQFHQQDTQITALERKLLNTEEQTIRELRPYL